VATVGELVSDSAQRVAIRCTGRPVLEIPASFANVVERRDHPHETVFEVSDDTRLGEVIAWLIGHQVELRAVTPQRATLEELFMATAAQSALGRTAAGRVA